MPVTIGGLPINFDPEFLVLMKSIATLTQRGSTDGYGNQVSVVYSPPLTFPCHITYKTKMVWGNTEENSTSTAQLQAPPPGYVITDSQGVVSSVPTILTQDQVILPDGIPRRVLLVTLITDEVGVHHQSISLT